MTMELHVPENEPGTDAEARAERAGRERGQGSGNERGERGGRRRRGPRPRWFVITVGVVVTLLGIAVGVPLMVGYRVWHQARQDERPRSDAIIVLGAARPGFSALLPGDVETEAQQALVSALP
ncbi:hypothetical protein AB0J52_25215, partial [Spirillospora sp. NPDC049652]